MNYKDNIKEELKWIYGIKEKVPYFLKRIKGSKRRGFYKYSLSGDLFGERIKWGLGNSVFFLKILCILGLEKSNNQEVKEVINYILSFQRKDGSIYDPFVSISSLPLRIIQCLKSIKLTHLRNKEYKRAETRQAISALSLFGVKPTYEYKKIPKNYKEIDKFLNSLNWELPWGAGSHFSHLLFFLRNSSLKNKDQLSDYAINWINSLQSTNDGFWYKGSPSIQEKINGAMKIITGLKVLDKISFKYPEKKIGRAHV